MYDNYNYPMGADTPSAPWNQPEPKEEKLKCYASQTLVKHTDVTTTDYELDCDFDDAGHEVNRSIITKDTDFDKAYKECRYTPLEIINEFAKVLPDLIEKAKESVGKNNYYKYINLLDDCQGWVEEEFYACDDNE